jgi:hypothetical protein
MTISHSQVLLTLAAGALMLATFTGTSAGSDAVLPLWEKLLISPHLDYQDNQPPNTEPNCETVEDECACFGCWKHGLNQITCPSGGNPPIIVPSFQKAGKNACSITESGCGTANMPKKCSGTFKVKVSWPAVTTPPACRTELWVQGGDAYPVVTNINNDSADSTYILEADCGGSKTKIFKVWYSEPEHANVPPDAQYWFKVDCTSCQTTDPCAAQR